MLCDLALYQFNWSELNWTVLKLIIINVDQPLNLYHKNADTVENDDANNTSSAGKVFQDRVPAKTKQIFESIFI